MTLMALPVILCDLCAHQHLQPHHRVQPLYTLNNIGVKRQWSYLNPLRFAPALTQKAFAGMAMCEQR